MTIWLTRGGAVLAVAVLAGSVVNASWLAPDPAGGVKLVAHRGIYQNYDHTGEQQDTCTATRIEQPVHDYLENTTRSMRKTQQIGAQMVEVDIAPTADGQIAIFHDWTVDCRTDGSGDTRDFTMDQLKTLDIGYGYSADGGQSFPFRGTGVGAMPTLEEALAALPRTPIIFNFKSTNAAEADLLAQRLIASGRDVAGIGDAFYGHPAPVAAIRDHFPGNWSFSVDGARACTQAYILYGWTGILPSACEGGTMIVPLNYQWAIWGWPNRAIARMEGAGGRILVIGPYGEDDAPTGLSLPEQLPEIPASYNGYVWVEDIWTLGPALRPSQDRRSDAEAIAAQQGLDRRRARMDR